MSARQLAATAIASLALIQIPAAAQCQTADYGPFDYTVHDLTPIRSTDIDGSVAAFGDQNDNLVSVIRRAGTQWSSDGQLTPSDGSSAAWFGNSVAIDGNTIVVADRRGNLYFFERSFTGWFETQKLSVPIDVAFTDVAIDVSGDTVVAGFWRQGGHVGQALVIERSPAGWAVSVTLAASIPAASEFGRSVALDGDRIVVGAPGLSGVGEGYAFLFERTLAGWVEAAVVQPSQPVIGDQFGISVTVSGARFAVGAARSHEATGAWVFEPAVTGWSQAASISLTSAQPVFFGSVVALDGDELLVGDRGFRAIGRVTGAGFLFVRNGGGWVLERTLVPDLDGGHRAGASGALSAGDAILGGSGTFFPPYEVSPGWVFLFGASGDCNHDGEVDLCEVLAGAPDNDADGVLDICASLDFYCEAGTHSGGMQARIGAEGSSGVAANNLTLVASDLPAPGNVGLFFFGDTPDQLPLGSGFLCLSTAGQLLRLNPIVAIDQPAVTRALDYGQAPASLITVSSTWNFQFWYRDAGQTNATDAVAISFIP